MATTKHELRTKTLEAREALDPDVRSLRDRLIFQRAHKDRVFQLASLVHVYRNSVFEVETTMFIEYAWGIGKEVAVPRVISDTQFESVLVTRSTTWERDQFGILNPVDGTVVPASDFSKQNAAIVPLTCFDQQRNRIGRPNRFRNQGGKAQV